MDTKPLLERWWTPPITHALAFLLLPTAIPYGVHSLLHWHQLTFVLIGAGAIAGPLLLARFQRSSFLVAGFFELQVGAAIMFTWPREQLGNWNVQVADHLLLWSLAGFALCSAGQAAYLWWRMGSRSLSA